MEIPSRDDISSNSPEQQTANIPNDSAFNSSEDAAPAFNPGPRFYLAFSSLTVLAMMVALDGTSVSVALPVRLPQSFYSSEFSS